MDSNFKRLIVDNSETIEQLAKKICGYGYFDEFQVRDCSYPVPIEAIKEYIEIGVMFAEKQKKI